MIILVILNLYQFPFISKSLAMCYLNHLGSRKNIQLILITSISNHIDIEVSIQVPKNHKHLSLDYQIQLNFYKKLITITHQFI